METEEAAIISLSGWDFSDTLNVASLTVPLRQELHHHHRRLPQLDSDAGVVVSTS